MNHIEERIGEVGIKADDIEHVGGTVCIECDVCHGHMSWDGSPKYSFGLSQIELRDTFPCFTLEGANQACIAAGWVNDNGWIKCAKCAQTRPAKIPNPVALVFHVVSWPFGQLILLLMSIDPVLTWTCKRLERMGARQQAKMLHELITRYKQRTRRGA